MVIFLSGARLVVRELEEHGYLKLGVSSCSLNYITLFISILILMLTAVTLCSLLYRVVYGIGVTFIEPLYYSSFFSREKVYGYSNDFERFVNSLKITLQLNEVGSEFHTSYCLPFLNICHLKAFSSNYVLSPFFL